MIFYNLINQLLFLVILTCAVLGIFIFNKTSYYAKLITIYASIQILKNYYLFIYSLSYGYNHHLLLLFDLFDLPTTSLIYYAFYRRNKFDFAKYIIPITLVLFIIEFSISYFYYRMNEMPYINFIITFTYLLFLGLLLNYLFLNKNSKFTFIEKYEFKIFNVFLVNYFFLCFFYIFLNQHSAWLFTYSILVIISLIFYSLLSVILVYDYLNDIKLKLNG